MARTNQIQVRRGTATQWSNTNPVLASGEPGFDTTNSLLKVGDGTSTWSSLSSNVGVGDAGLLSIAGLTTASGSYLFATANDVYTTGISTVYGRSVLAASGVESLVTTTLTAGTGILLSYNSGTDTVTISTSGLVIGTNVQAYNSVLASTFAGGRLTLESGVAISTTDQTAKTILYYTPYSHSSIGLYDTTNSVWTPYNFTQTSLALGTLSSGVNYDTFMYSNSGTLTLAASSWASNTARTTAISLQDGVYVKTSDKSHRYLGTFRTTATTTTEDSEAKRFVYNVNNQVPRHSLGVLGYVNDNAAVTFTLSSLNTWVALNGGVGNKCEWVNGLTSTCMLVGESFAVAGAAGYVIIGIGIDSTTNGDFIVLQSDNTATSTFGRGASKAYVFTLGYHFISLNGYTTGGTATIYKEDSRNGGTVDPIRTWIAAQQNM